ncbi:hypothetical protein RB195_007582 [Necator americanus]|uniref:Uncharacterized protein n=1 Tax=Necator americanus TaxID=51031 RepID=A0ABR1BZJ8_NECAM
MRADWDVAFDSDNLPVLSFMIRFQKKYRGAQHQPNLDLASLKKEECRKFRQRVLINIGLRTRKKVDDADSFTKCIHDTAKYSWSQRRGRSWPLRLETKSTYNSVCVARITGDFNWEKRLRRKLRRQLQQDRDNEWT